MRYSPGLDLEGDHSCATRFPRQTTQSQVLGEGVQIGDTFRGIPSAYSSRSVRFPVRISVPMERVFKGEEAERSPQELERAQHRRSTGRQQEAVGGYGRNQAPSGRR